MTVIIVPRPLLRNLSPDAQARNGLVVDWRLGRNVADRLNWVLAHARKCVFQKSCEPGNPPQSSASSLVPWRWKCRTGEISSTTGQAQFLAIGATAPDTGTATDAKWRMVINSGGDTASAYVGHPLIVASPTMDDVIYLTTSINISADTEYDCRIEVENGCRVLSMMVYEIHPPLVDTADAIATDSTLNFHGSEITDGQHTDMLDNGHKLWKHNGSHLFSLNPETENGFWTRTTATYANMLDQAASTTVAAGTPGMNAQVQYYNPYHSANVPCVFAAFATNAVAPGGDVRIADDNGTIATLSSFGTGGEWKSTAINLDGTIDTHKVDIHIQGDGVNELTVEAVSVYVYEA